MSSQSETTLKATLRLIAAYVALGPLRANIPEIRQKRDYFAVFAGTSAKYRGHQEIKGVKKGGDEQMEKDL